MDAKRLTYAQWAALARMSADRIVAECEVETFHAHGPGGQGVNTADSAVRMTHVPSGIAVVSRESRSQWRNRQLCVAKLHAEFARRAQRPKVRKATKPTKGSIERRLKAKAARSQLKATRGRISRDE